MPGIARVNIDTAGDTITGNLAPKVQINGSPVVVVGATVKGHGSGTHAAPTMNEGSSTVFANGKAICRAGDKATCGHAATGSSDVNAG